MKKLFQMTKKVIVLPLELCRKFRFIDLVSKKIYITCFFICIYCIAGRHVTDSDLQPAASSSSLRQQSAALLQPSTSKRSLEKIDQKKETKKLNEDIQVTKLSVSKSSNKYYIHVKYSRSKMIFIFCTEVHRDSRG